METSLHTESDTRFKESADYILYECIIYIFMTILYMTIYNIELNAETVWN